jgi:Inhibitor of Apoptosis domain
MAHAGFYYDPYEDNPDNTMCFLCLRSLDGWEEGDDPITEHLKHSSECGWAIIMDIGRQTSSPSEIEDPTGTRIAEARRATFGSSWPYDGKRGWMCQSQKVLG